MNFCREAPRSTFDMFFLFWEKLNSDRLFLKFSAASVERLLFLQAVFFIRRYSSIGARRMDATSRRSSDGVCFCRRPRGAEGFSGLLLRTKAFIHCPSLKSPLSRRWAVTGSVRRSLNVNRPLWLWPLLCPRVVTEVSPSLCPWTLQHGSDRGGAGTGKDRFANRPLLQGRDRKTAATLSDWWAPNVSASSWPLSKVNTVKIKLSRRVWPEQDPLHSRSRSPKQKAWNKVKLFIGAVTVDTVKVTTWAEQEALKLGARTTSIRIKTPLDDFRNK